LKLLFLLAGFYWAVFPSWASAMTVDGILDESEWETATRYTNFVTVTPFSLSSPEFKTEARIFSDESGIYIGINNHQPLNTQISERTARDLEMQADRNTVTVDFDNTGIAAYSFEVGNGGSMRDGIWRDENAFSDDWDGLWTMRTSSTGDRWTSEIFVPWDVATMVKVTNKTREIGLHVTRDVAYLSKKYANAPIDDSRQRFLSALETLKIDDYSGSSLQTFGYATSTSDRVKDDNKVKAGIDLFWKPDSSKQVSLTINPDFGHVDSDQLVVNFSPTETFFSENRAFFTENQALFDLQGIDDLRVIHTRRIGGRPDAGEDVVSDIAAALKFTSVGEDFNYGFFSAVEGDEQHVEGRNYYAGRVMRKTDDYSLGYLLTYTDRPDIEREATVHTLDFSNNLSSTLKFGGQLIRTLTETEGEQKNDSGGWINIEQQIASTWDHSLQVSYYGSQFEINDLGYLPRNNYKRVNYTNNWQDHTFSENSFVNERKIETVLKHQENTEGDRLNTSVSVKDSWFFKNTSLSFWRIAVNSDGVDDLITRGNNTVKTKWGKELELLYFGDSRGSFKYHVNLKMYDQTVDGKGFRLHVHPSYQFTDNYVVSLGTWLTSSRDWLIWQQDDRINSYQKKQFAAYFDARATFSDKQELSLKFEWIALRAKGNNGYDVSSGGSLLRRRENVEDFSLSSTAVQLRYRYQIGPLSNIYAVYSRGGSATLRDELSFSSLFSPGWDARDGDNLLFKIRYQF